MVGETGISSGLLGVVSLARIEGARILIDSYILLCLCAGLGWLPETRPRDRSEFHEAFSTPGKTGVTIIQ